jgi:hypothetical protein
MRRPSWLVALAAPLALTLAATGCGSTAAVTAAPPVHAPADPTGTPAAVPTLTPGPPTDTGSGSGGSGSGGSGSGGSGHGGSTTTRPPAAPGRPTGQLALGGVKRCHWQPGIFIDINGGPAQGGVQFEIFLRAAPLNLSTGRTLDIPVVATGTYGESATQTSRFTGSSTPQTTSALYLISAKPALAGAYTMRLIVASDPARLVDQNGAYADDATIVTIDVPADRPKQPEDLGCGWVMKP